MGGRAVGHKTLYQFVDIVDMISPIAAPSLDTFGNKTLAVTRLDGRDTIFGFINCYVEYQCSFNLNMFRYDGG